MQNPEPVTNFGENIRYTPAHRYAPKDEAEVLDILSRHRTGTVRVTGSLHSWSDVAATDDVAIDMHNFQKVRVVERREGLTVEVGGGCTVERLFRLLRRHTRATLPATGEVTKQTLAGAISTGTHGSGLPSMSHYVVGMRVAAYTANGEPAIYEWTGGPELDAARCGLGCQGVILSVTMELTPQFNVEERLEPAGSLDEVLRDESRMPLQEFVVTPYSWRWMVFRRRPTQRRPSLRARLAARLYLLFDVVVIDVLLHVLIVLLARISRRAGWIVRATYRWAAPPALVGLWTVVDRSEVRLTRNHHLFRHVELELFIPASHFHDAVDLASELTACAAGESRDVPEQVRDALRQVGMEDELDAIAGRYVHHYPIFFRRVLPERGMISMTAGASEQHYTMSFFTYDLDLTGFEQFATLLARSLARLYGVKPHWGKFFPLVREDVEPLYPELDRFRARCREIDPNGVFRNAYTARVLGLE